MSYKFFKKLIPGDLKRHVKEDLGVPSLHWSLQNIKKAGYSSITAIDMGAFEGEWSADFLEVFPQANILMIDGQQSKAGILKKFCASHPNVDYEIAVLSSKSDKELFFYENETVSHVGNVIGPGSKIAISKSLDDIIVERNFPAPDFLKLDVQGHELEVLDGSLLSLKHAAFVQLEVTLLNMYNIPLVKDAINYMDEKSFQLYDVTQFIRRPSDRALFQADFLFIKKDHPLALGTTW